MPYLRDEPFIRVVVTRAQPCIPTQAFCDQNSMIDVLDGHREGRPISFKACPLTLSVVEELLIPLEVLKRRIPALHPCPPDTRHVRPRPSPTLRCPWIALPSTLLRRGSHRTIWRLTKGSSICGRPRLTKAVW